MAKCTICGEILVSFADKASTICKACRKEQFKQKSSYGRAILGGTLGGPKISAGYFNKCSYCGKMSSSSMEKISGICDTCKKKLGEFKDLTDKFLYCSKCGNLLFSYDKKKKGICDYCLAIEKRA